MLAAVFLGIGALVGLCCQSRTKAFGVSMFLWFFFVLFYDLAVIGMAFVLRERTANFVILLSLFGNPVDVARASSLLSVSDPAIFGAAGAALLKFAGGAARCYAALVCALLAWLTLPLIAAGKVLRRVDL